MTWNWQQPDWTEFRWEAARLKEAEAEFLRQGGELAGVLRHFSPEDRQTVAIERMSAEALTTSRIEGEILDRESVQSSIRRQLGLAADRRRSRPGEEGVAELMVDLIRSVDTQLDEETLFRWHRMLMKGRRDLRDYGSYRTGDDPMEVVSGDTQFPNVHFEAPPSRQVLHEMATFLDWFARTAPDGTDSLSGLTRAGIAHLYFESIHPFEDGNGRIGRAIAEKALMQALGGSSFTALSTTILQKRREYYAALEVANKSNEVTGWLEWFAGITLEAQRSALAEVEFVIQKTRLLDRLRGRLNARQEKALHRMLREGPGGFDGGLSAGNYMKITGASSATATRDLADLVAKGALRREGERRHARYWVAIGGSRK